MHKNYFGSERKNHLEWLSNDWRIKGPNVCFLEGFPGVGKSDLVAEVVTAFESTSEWTVVTYEIPDRPSILIVDVWLDIADQLAHQNRPKMQEVMLGEDEGNPAFAIEKALNRNVLIVLDEAQRLFDPDSGRPVDQLAGILAFLKTRPNLPGRLLLLSDRLVERERWSESFAIRTLNALQPSEAAALLDDRLAVNAVDDVPNERKNDLLRVLGYNPRAIETLVASLLYEPLDEIVGSDPGVWETQDRDVSPEFLAKLERQLLERTLAHLDELHLKRLTMLAAHRSGFDQAAFEAVCGGTRKEWRELRNALITRFFVRHTKSYYSLHPVVREISVARLKDNPAEFIQAHSKASDYHLRHFHARSIVLQGQRLSTSYAELRYHLFQSQREGELRDIALRVADHIGREFTQGSPIPSNADELNERISLLKAILSYGGSHWLEHYVSRMLLARGYPGDVQLALEHAEKSLVIRAPAEYWVLAARLQETQITLEKAIKTILQASEVVDRNSNRSTLYLFGAELLVKNNEIDEAIKFLRQGLLDVPPEKALSSLYILAADIIAEYRDVDVAVALLHEGLRVVPADKDLSSIYHRYCELIHQTKDVKGAIVALDQGLSIVPADKGLSSLFLLKAEFLGGLGKPEMALDSLKVGIGKIAPGKGLDLLYGRASELLCELGRKEDAVAMLREAVERLRADQGGVALRQSLARLEALMMATPVRANSGAARIEPDLLDRTLPTALVMATEWFSLHGGISTFNRNLCIKLAHNGINVICAVPKASREEIEAAALDGIYLLQSPAAQSADPLNGMYRRLSVPIDPDFVIGHGRITGHVAQAQVEDNFPSAARVHFVHMAPGEIEWFKGKADAAMVAESREREELELASSAKVVAAVGPRLFREVGNLLESKSVKPALIEFNPSCIAPAEPRTRPPHLHCLLLGRAEDLELKGLDIAALAMARVASGATVAFESRPELIVRGAPAGTGQVLQQRLKSLTEGLELSVRVREYSSSQDDIQADLRRASILLMPSRREGFGLVALEALTLGTPILVSDQSGIAELITRYVSPAEASGIIVPTPEAVSSAASTWARAIEFQLADRDASFNRAWRLSTRLMQEDGWSKSVRGLLSRLGVEDCSLV
ncbi:Glycosyltransferase involved in cell wall bisynthesis [Paraburkholderia phenazinium]|uniref:Glycosyltransferase involved in cell wall bisynthesis n=2 Tax=Paraburkholderia phenazinium TaxID=60549 RepID=A0A1N6KK84_9BURK|nr:Glycosyltransferase involved in cell wall bisynthesis [Paraburkholderia phenazinium]